MTTMNDDRTVTDRERQVEPLPGETDPKDAFIKARLFASLTASKLTCSETKLK
jgi:hypothetical protein